MAMKPKKIISSRGESGVGGGSRGVSGIGGFGMPERVRSRVIAKITGSGGANVSPIYKESIPPASVKVVQPSRLAGVKNRTENVTAKLRKSGEAASRSAADVNVGTPAKTVKINSAGKRTSGSK